MSEGFNPRPKISFPIALAVGLEGLDEVVEVELNEWVHTSQLPNQLKRQLPHGIEVTSAETIPPGEGAQVKDVTCRVRLIGRTITPAAIEELLQKKEVLVCRKKNGTKRFFNIRPSIIDIAAGVNFLELKLRTTPEGMARPEEVISALGLDSEIDYRLLETTRTKVDLGGR